MKPYWFAAAAGLALAATACGQGQSPAFATLQDSASYAVGMSMGRQLQEVKDEIAVDQVVQGIRDILESDTTRLTPMDAQRVMQAYGQEVQQRQQQARASEADSNLARGEAYRAENARRVGVQTTPSGLQYEVLTAAEGPKPTAESVVRVHYRGTLIDGREFDRSDPNGAGVSFALNQVIPGWTEAVQLMSVGSKYRFVVPPQIGYGEMGSPPDIGPNATLIFEVELLGIE
jgi:FKBP-type peptidyl-prolyl cis-trans isomerase FkpA/FKBP-type peptidyl-prolyl cis-trans isomerase FklB